MKSALILALSLLTSASMAESKIVDALSDGSTVVCTAAYELGNKLETKQIDMLYRVDQGMREAVAYVKRVQLGNYSYDGSCSHLICELSVRDLKTNTLSTANGLFAPLNLNTIYVSVTNYGSKPNAHVTLSCTKSASK